ncbi:hypothetical protein A2U01_0047289, partial [Trifolium medium]|nr:hypothetical protein [Trifolium medium]
SVIEDKVIWRFEKNDIYSVNSVYCIDEAINTTGLRVPGEALGFLSALNWIHDLCLKDVDFKLD